MNASALAQKLTAGCNRVILCREVLADLETPLSAFLKLCHQEPTAFLLESVEGSERVARYSFLGCRPIAALVFGNGGSMIYRGRDAARHVGSEGFLAGWRNLPSVSGDPLENLRELLGDFRGTPAVVLRGQGDKLTAEPLRAPLAPRFLGGAVGYLAYDVVRLWERLPQAPPDRLGLPDALFIVPELVAAFDRVRQKMLVAVVAELGPEPEMGLLRALNLLDEALGRLRRPLPNWGMPTRSGPRSSPESQMSAQHFMEAVRRIKEYIAAGDAFQVVLSQRLEVPQVRAHPIDIYRALRAINPSPYMFYLSFGELKLIGASPEMMVRVEGDTVEVRPIAGTAPRADDEGEDLRRERALLEDEKERAEHLMLVDLARNDLGRVCTYGSIEVRELMRVERYSHVMHLVSEVRGRLAPGHDALSALRACFPAGTLSGAPKVRAMQIIDELEPTRRGPYGGAVGYVSFLGNLDTCITIRTLVLKGSRAFVQAGAGIVADSEPQREWEETLHKARAVLRALEIAEEGLQ